MPEAKSSLQLELQELLLVGVGAVPGALLRWQLALHLGDQNLLVNVLGAALLGFLAGLPASPRRQLLLGIASHRRRVKSQLGGVSQQLACELPVGSRCQVAGQ